MIYEQKKIKLNIYYIIIFIFIGSLYVFFPFVEDLSNSNNKFNHNRCVYKINNWFLLFKPQNLIPIYKHDGRRQCGDQKKLISVKHIKKQLQKKGIKVFKTIKGSLNNNRALASCSSLANSINIFYIYKKQKQLALKYGFYSCLRQ